LLMLFWIVQIVELYASTRCSKGGDVVFIDSLEFCCGQGCS
jgi:hypothetical protein